ncbi:hypothetical protein [Flavobacterium pectinovorum]|uniref:Uncharacterized protein n=1 Tax=Flavobacterium pectinovorum TaxID=29533 RepID=A0A502EWT6_9FLAO|nr:hypothetical protein [Flavobacterium pectinovorum]TPG42017.1 hypothetical protein EAH81_06745 [Flavobacterium pectinovorum]
MNLESLKLDKFKDCTLKKEQLFMLNGGGIKSDPGTVCGLHAGKLQKYDYGYDIERGGHLTFHDRFNVRQCDPILKLTEEDRLPLR